MFESYMTALFQVYGSFKNISVSLFEWVYTSDPKN